MVLVSGGIGGWILHVGDRRPPHARSRREHANSDQPAEVVTKQDVTWLVAYLRAVVVASPAVVWAGRGMTLLQLVALHLISALAR